MKYLTAALLLSTLLVNVTAFADTAALRCESIFNEVAEGNFKLTSVIFLNPSVSQDLWNDYPAYTYLGHVTTAAIVFGPKGILKKTEEHSSRTIDNYGRNAGRISVDDPAWSEGAQKGLHQVHDSYENRFFDREIQLVKDLDASTFNAIFNRNQMGYAAIENSDGHLVGFLRVIRGDTGDLPAEKILAAKNVKTEYFKEKRKRGKIYELGKYFLSEDLSPDDLKLVRNYLFKWLTDNYSTSYLDTYIIDVGSAAHERAYRTMFGTVKVDRKNFDPPLESPNAILEVDGYTLRNRLYKLIKENK
jgi:hypothetical protein